jgi:hypothetical protein
MESGSKDRPKESNNPAVSVSNRKASEQRPKKSGFMKRFFEKLGRGAIEPSISRASCPT